MLPFYIIFQSAYVARFIEAVTKMSFDRVAQYQHDAQQCREQQDVDFSLGKCVRVKPSSLAVRLEGEHHAEDTSHDLQNTEHDRTQLL
eukprot:m.403479 g.403479  ORF g.403479 m.403479 type:complete len:88 (-) comp21193_c1_seq6:497-760(-)